MNVPLREICNGMALQAWPTRLGEFKYKGSKN